MNYTYSQQQQQGYSPYRMAQPWGGLNQVRPVTSLEEVKASPIDFDGSVFYFPDFANKIIYTKFINLDGTVTINAYELKTDQATSSPYVTRNEFEAQIQELRELLKNRETTAPAAQSLVEYKF